MAPAWKTWTDRELEALPHLGKWELVDGHLENMSPAVFNHEEITMAVAIELGAYVKRRKLGVVCGSELGCWMRSGNMLCPDVSFIRLDRVPRAEERRRKFFRGAPDLAVEVRSPSESRPRIERKIREYLKNGTRLVWEIDPRARIALVHLPAAESEAVGLDGALDGRDVVPGFRLPLSELFRPVWG